MILLLVDNSAEIYQFTIILIFVVALIFFVSMYWYSISLERSVQEQMKTKESLLVSSHELQSMQLKNRILEVERAAKDEKALRLEQEITLRNNELVTSTMMINQQRKLMEEINEMIKKLEKESNPSRTVLRRLARLTNVKRSTEKNWTTFRKQFDHVHPHFIESIDKRFPKLTQNDLRHCAYIRMRLSTKEIAELMGINPTSVQIARVRLKKKMELSEDIDVKKFVINYEP